MSKKGSNKKAEGNGSVARKVKCFETGEVFETVSKAAEFANCSQGAVSRSAIRDVPVKGYRFQYL